jgi:hypothetical protein
MGEMYVPLEAIQVGVAEALQPTALLQAFQAELNDEKQVSACQHRRHVRGQAHYRRTTHARNERS